LYAEREDLPRVVELGVDRTRAVSARCCGHDRAVDLDGASALHAAWVVVVVNLGDDVLPFGIARSTPGDEVARVAERDDAGIDADVPDEAFVVAH
jgi:hypothetical protein